MRNLEALSKNLLQSEFTEANNLYHEMRVAGYPPAKISAMLYRAGRLAGVESVRDSTRKFHTEYHRLKERVKDLEDVIASEPVVIIDDIGPCATCRAAAEAEKEGGNENE